MHKSIEVRGLDALVYAFGVKHSEGILKCGLIVVRDGMDMDTVTLSDGQSSYRVELPESVLRKAKPIKKQNAEMRVI